MKYAEVCDYLNRVQNQTDIKFGLDTVRTILRRKIKDTPFPRFIQVAGTNGKGSTCYYLSAILTRGGIRTGRFLSPHLIDIRERISIDSRWISRGDFARIGSRVIRWSTELREREIIDRQPTFFEFLFLMAVLYFQEENVELAVMEVGLGGRLDATSAVTPVACIITRISRDHERWLGHDIISIAREKAGIIKKGIPVFSYQGPASPAGRVLERTAQTLQAPFHALTGIRIRRITESPGSWMYRGQQVFRFRLVNDASHLARNAACALMAVEWLIEKQGYVISAETAGQALSTVELPGRIQFFNIPGSHEIILDIAHNPDGFTALAKVLKARGYQSMVLVFGVLRDKKYKKMLDKILRFVKMVIITEPESHRSCDGRIIGNYLEGRKKWFYVKGIKKALAMAREGRGPVLVAGSFYLVGPVMGILSQEVQCEKRNV